MAVQDAYFDLFEASGMENKVGSRDAAFKSTLEGHFTRLVGLMKAEKPVEQLQAEAVALQKIWSMRPRCWGWRRDRLESVHLQFVDHCT